MKTLKDYRDAYAIKQERMQEILDAAENEDRALKGSEQKELRTLSADLAKLEGQIDAQKEVEKRIADKVSGNRNYRANGDDPAAEIVVTRELMQSREWQRTHQAITRKDKKNVFGKWAVAAKTGQGDSELRALTSSGGSAMIPSEIFQEVLYDSLAANPLRDLGVQYRSVSQNSKWPRITAYPDADWVASEGTQVTEDSSTTIGSVDVSLNDLAVLIRVQDQLLLDAAVDIESVLQTSATMAINNAVLTKFFHGDGTGGTPTGLDNLTGINTVSAGNAALTDYSDIIGSMYELLVDNVPLDRIGMASHPNVWKQLTSLTASDNQPLMAPADVGNMMKRYTSAIDTTFGGGSNETKAYFGDFSKAVIGLQGPFRFVMDDRYKDYLQTGFLIWLRVDFAFLEPDNFCRLDDILTT